MPVEVFDNFGMAPLDEPPDWEGDDSGPITVARINMPSFTRPTMAAQQTPTLVVPFRPCEPGATGDHVYALKRAHARFRGGGRLTRLEAKPPSVKRTWSRYTGPGSFYRDFKETRRLLGLSGPVVYDDDAWRKLARWFDAKALSLVAPPKNTIGQKQLAWHMALYNRRYQVPYSQARPSQLGRPEAITRADCSGSVAAGCDYAGILPQVDWRWTNTWLQVKMGRRIPTIGEAAIGDIFFYGSPSHEAMYLGGGRVWSFGSYPIKLLDYRYRSDFTQIRRFS